jgi:hypothetical protein
MMAAPVKKPKPNVEPEAFTSAEVRVKLRCSKDYLNKQYRSGRLKSFLRGNNRMVYRSALNAFMAMTEAEGLNPEGSVRMDGWRVKKKKSDD